MAPFLFVTHSDKKNKKEKKNNRHILKKNKKKNIYIDNYILNMKRQFKIPEI